MLAWLREDEGDRLLAAVNFAVVPSRLAVRRELRADRATLVLSTDPDRAEGEVDVDRLTLGPSEAVLLRREL